jgi:hypothetical protein
MRMQARMRCRSETVDSREGRSWNWHAPTEMRLSTSGELKEEGGHDPLAVCRCGTIFSLSRPCLTLRRDLGSSERDSAVSGSHVRVVRNVPNVSATNNRKFLRHITRNILGSTIPNPVVDPD